MADERIKEYKGWTIKLTPEGEKCSAYAMVLIDPSGNEAKHVPTAGDTEDRAFERGMEMIDMELKLAE